MRQFALIFTNINALTVPNKDKINCHSIENTPKYFFKSGLPKKANNSMKHNNKSCQYFIAQLINKKRTLLDANYPPASCLLKCFDQKVLFTLPGGLMSNAWP